MSAQPWWSDLPREQIGAGAAPALIDELLALILAGKKTASTGARAQYETIPKAGDRCVLLDGARRPRCVIEDEEVFVTRFDDVPEAFALLEGEGDFAQWRMAHEKFFAERAGGFSPDMMVVCERYKVLEVIAP